MVRAGQERRERLVHSAIRAGWNKFGAVELDEASYDYIAGVACAVVAECAAADEAERELLEQLGPHLEEHSLKPKQAASLCKAIARCTVPAATAPAAEPDAKAEGRAARGAEVLCRVQDLILMYLGSTQLLLKNTTLELLRGHRYGIVGSNGAGKTTLMERIADGAISELASSNLRFMHIRHDTLVERADPAMRAVDFARGLVGDEAPLHNSLDEVGFSAEMRQKALRELSGGWRVRLLLAAAVAQRADVLLLDEPTNHLDASAMAWLVKYLTQDLRGSTCLVVSHDAHFLDKICTDIIHFDDRQLRYYRGNFRRFQEQAKVLDEEQIRTILRVRDAGQIAQRATATRGAAAVKANAPAAREAQLEKGGAASTPKADEATSDKMVFPIPGKVEGITTGKKAVIEMKDVWFKYAMALEYTLRRVSCRVTMSSRIAIVGPNGAGKSTLLSLLCGEIRPSADDNGKLGQFLRHRCLRLAYVAQSHAFHLGEYSRCTAVEYIQLRFKAGYDEELQKRLNSPLDEEEERRLNTLAARYGKYSKRVEALISRTKRQNEYRYEVKWRGLDEKQNTFESVAKLRQLGVERMAAALDERLACLQAGFVERPLTTREIVKHFEGFGLSEDLVERHAICSYSGGQKSKLMLAAALWTKPHVVCLDEPTNFLDFETVASLSRALRNFRGGVVIVSHNEDFLASICNEIWSVQDHEVSIVSATSPPVEEQEDCVEPPS
mmetsp:Transcript_95061/g.273645  ORF Transcript_95061/g.273645 Transcript_95061/m.273645 type:complete len:725 (+) Transcript_95061:124-2298(+)|eukprot:CAMPEP_0170249858 /NCGR_PEP_ID=MMETSP0116_2-20130129/24739_1 /TAXON_ID=400756 /ORGANISM="Durinskia baltica, Strain CSIRO CS-38" /LENGTH=724 /DNA_ID=CAMNT_0010500781 /DNA_START=30 /DNA_END=2204 /DNA_ORIENTATION=-